MKHLIQSAFTNIVVLLLFVNSLHSQNEYDTLYFYSPDLTLEQAQNKFETAILEKSNTAFEDAEIYAKAYYQYALDTEDSTAIGKALYQLGQIQLKASEHSSALNSLNAALTIAVSQKDTTAIINIERNLGDVYITVRKRDQAFEKFQISLALAKESSDSINMAKALNNLSVISTQVHEYEKSLNYLNRALDLKIAFAPKWDHISTLINIGNNYANLGNHQKALNYLERAKKIAIQYKKTRQLAQIWYHIANVQRRTTNSQLTEDAFYKSLKISNEINDLTSNNRCKKAFAAYLMEIKKWELAETYLESLLHNLDEKENPVLLSEIYFALGKIAYNSKNNIKAKVWLNQSVSITTETNKKTLRDAYNLLSIISYVNSEFEMAYHYLRISNMMGDSIIAIEKNDKLEELQLKYNSVNDKKSIENLLELSELRETEKDKSKFYFLITFSLFIITLAVAIALARQARVRDRQSTELKQQIEENLKKTKDLIDAHKLAEEGLKVKSEFIAMVSHEIRTPMNAIIGMSSLLSDTPLNSHQKNYLSNISISSNNLLILLNDILDFSRVEAKKVNIKLQPSDLKKELTHVVNMFMPLAEEKQLTFKVDIDQKLPAIVFIDSPRIRQVIVNLLSNAIKFTHKGFVELNVKIVATEPTLNGEIATIRMEVSDSGIGVPQNKQKEIFSSFNQLDSKVSRKYSGVGLGLSISQGILGMMGAQIQLESEFAVGSTFWFELRVKSVREANKTIISHAGAKVKFDKELGLSCPLKILIAEDNEINQKLLKINLNKMGYNPVIVSNGQEALDQLKIQEFDVIFMDVQMPVLDGVSATKEIVRMYGNAKPIIVAVTANAMGTDKQSYIEAGMDDYISKPFTTKEIESCLRNWYNHINS
ncbi:MAG: signal transduction histidine kinase [Salibacteraceae bacterium]